MSREGDVDESKRATLRRFAALGATSPLVGLAKESESDAPDALLGYVAATPGAHFSKIRDDLQLGTGETQHHLRRLEREGAVESREDGEYRRYFPADRFSEFEQVALGYLRRDTPRGMVVALLRDPDASGTALADELGVSAPTVSKYASQLEDAGLLSREDGYDLERPETLLLLLVQHADSFGPKAAELAADADDIVSYDP
ncbi:winged helix-turn-helix transcriptional regulator [Halosimplex amylolyticum]|uniref:winged helix-turn-helix transcriptional regulator n=1 Tax=Halosimplex amylolyticum TaxID=3396616 RepID=UPI003F5434A1